MLLRSFPTANPFLHSLSPRLNLRGSGGGALPLRRRNGGCLVINVTNEANNRAILNAVFEPFEEVKKELLLLPTLPQASLARHNYPNPCEAAINDQIKDNVALKGLAKFFKEASAEEREHAEKFMEYQNKRGGNVKLQSMMMPISDYDHLEKGDALYAMELALSLEKLTNEKLLNLQRVADENSDAQLADFVESEFLVEQVESIKKISEYVAQLRRVGRGHGVWHFDQILVADTVAA
ncbi:hypothetical protein Pfo_006959 [Paulownia fortunei]|nr:hypothetical protein Pfo_006959 [Paulownia fortunei]